MHKHAHLQEKSWQFAVSDVISEEQERPLEKFLDIADSDIAAATDASSHRGGKGEILGEGSSEMHTHVQQ